MKNTQCSVIILDTEHYIAYWMLPCCIWQPEYT